MKPESQDQKTVAELGEDAVLAAIIPLLPSATGVLIGPGDDAAGLQTDGITFLSTDTMVAERDFSLAWSTPRDLGRKAVASNLADIAAMGVVPTGLLVALTLPPSITLDWALEFAAGLAQAIARLAPAAGVIGGDLALGDQVHIAVTSVGVLGQGQAVTRAGAKPGDRVAIAGAQGWSAAGFALLSNGSDPQQPESGKVPAVRAAISAHLSPEPPILLGDAARRAGATALIDVSDGLMRDAGRIAKASRVTIDFNSAQLQPLIVPLLEVAATLGGDSSEVAARARDWVLRGGEDHCLLATFPEDSQLPDGFRIIGKVAAGEQVAVQLDGRPEAAGGWDSLSSR